MTDFADLAPAEQSFRDLLRKPAELARWREDVNATWAEGPGREHVLRWEHHNGRSWPGRARKRRAA